MFFSDRATADELLNVMMFYDAAGGQSFAGLPNRYQSYCDLSRLLELGRAILVAEVPAPGQPMDRRRGRRAARAARRRVDRRVSICVAGGERVRSRRRLCLLSMHD